MQTLRIAVIPGDGIGEEVVPQGLRVLEAAAEIHGGLRFRWTHLDDWNCRRFVREGAMMPADGMRILGDHDGIFLGAVGWPGVPDHVSLWGLLIPIRRRFAQYVNLRPARLLRGIAPPLAGRHAGDIDMVVVRENCEGEYSAMGGRIHEGTPHEVAAQISYFSRMGIERVTRYALETARTRSRRLTVATKSNGIVHTMPFWDEVVREVAAGYPDVEVRFAHVDALAAQFVTRPEALDVVLGSNLFGDILTDLGAAIVGSIGIAPSANLNPERRHPSLFEPVHGSAPDIAGRGIANPIGQIWTAAMLLDFFGAAEVARLILAAVESALEAGVRTPDLGGRASTVEVADAVLTGMRRRG
jgi:tartrate dehydrogenase/decarboxylase/D-malate dehydrogenase